MSVPNKTYKIILTLSLFWLGIVFSATSQHIESKSNVDSLTIGDQTSIRYNLTFHKNQKPDFVFPKDTLTQYIEIIKQSKVDTTFMDDSVKLSKELIITSFDTGYMVVPPISFSVFEGQQMDTVKTQPLLLHFAAMSVDTTKAIKPIKPLQSVPIAFEEVLPWLLIMVGIIIIALLVWYLIRRKKGKKSLFTPKPKPALPEDEEALNHLQALAKKKLWQQGHFKAYFSELSYIVRHYIERRFDVPAIESTTDEIIDNLKNKTADEDQVLRLEKDFQLSDLVKFAKSEPLSHECENSFKNAVDFIEKNRSVKALEMLENTNKAEGGQHVE